MRISNFKSAMIKSVWAATILLSASGAALAQQAINLTAAPANAALSDGSLVPMWGYSCGVAAAGSTATCASLNPTTAATNWSPVLITVPTGQGLTINLTNNLPTTPGATAGLPTSLVIVGQLGGGLGTGATSTSSPDHSGVRSQTWFIAGAPAPASAQAPLQGNRVQSFATEIAAGTTTALTWTGLQPGTYLIESGTHPSIQGPMGLYGILVVTDATTGTAYPAAGVRAAVTYSADVPMLFSEIDPLQNTAVSQAVNTAGFSETTVWSGLKGACGDPAVHSCYPPTVNYSPLYYLINGRTFDTTNIAASLYPVTAASGNVLVRLVNAGLRMHVPSIVGSTTGAATGTPGITLVAEDGNVLPGQARIQSEVFMAAGKTYDVSINVPATVTTALPIYDRQLSLSANATGRNGGMLAYIGINGAAAPVASSGTSATNAVANADTYSLVPGQLLRIADQSKGVMANDNGVYAVQLLAPATNGTVTLLPSGTFYYFPAAGSTATTDTFSYCANGTVTAGVCSSGISAVVSLGPTTVADSGITCTVPAVTNYTATTATLMSVNTPGVLAFCKDGANLPLTVQTSTATASAGTVVAGANGGFTATAPGAGTYTYTFTVQNPKQQTATATVTVAFPPASNLSVKVLDGVDHVTPITDYRWIIEEDRTFYVDPACTSNPLPAGCPTISSTVANPINYGTNFHSSSMPVVAAGCTGTLSCEGGQSLQSVPAACDVGNGVCDTTRTQQTALDPSLVVLDPTKRYYISILPGDAASPFNAAYTGAPDCSAAGVAAGQCGHGMGGAPIAAACGAQSATKVACTASAAFAPVTVLTMPTPLQPATLSVFVYQDDFPLNGEHGSGGGIDVLAPQEPGLGGFQVTIFDQAGGTGDTTGQPTYDMFNQALSNSLAGTIDPVTGLDACPVSSVASADSVYNKANAVAIAAGTLAPKSAVSGMIVTCPKFEGDGRTLSPMAGQALVKNLYPGRYGIAALPGASRIALGEEWVQTNTLDGQKTHDSFLRVGEPGYFQEFGPAGFHVSIGFANPKVINERRYNDTHSGMCDTGAVGGNLTCTFEVIGKVTGSRLSRTPDQRLYSSGGRSALSFTQCYVSLGDPDGAEIAFSKCAADGSFDFKGIPAGNWKVTTFDQWNDQIIDGITQPVAVGCGNNVGGLCAPLAGNGVPNKATCTGAGTIGNTCDMGEIGVHQWQANIYTRSFIDMAGTGVSDSSKPGLALAETNIRFRDGSYSNQNNTDLNGNAGFNEVFPLFNWYVIETDNTRYKNTGVHVIYDAGGPADGSSSCDPTASPCGNSQSAAGLANTYEKFPLPADLSVPGAVYCATGDADCASESIANGPKPSSTTKNSTGRIDPPFWFGSYGWQGYIGQGNFLEWGKKPFAANETGPIHGHVVYASTRPFDDPQLLLQLTWEPLVAHVHVNLYQEGVATDGVTQTLTLVDQTDTTSWDDWAQGFRSDGQPNMNCPGQQLAPTATSGGDPFFYALNNQPQYLDWYKSQHGGPAVTALPHGAQYKCYDGMHTWNQLQPAPYDGMYSFPSVKGFDPATGKPSGTNCTACIANPDTNDLYRVGAPMLPPGKYVVEVVVPPGYELVKEEDKNILIGDNYIAPAAVQIPGLGGAIYILPDQAMLAEAFNPLNAQNSTTNLGRNSALPSHEGDTGTHESFWPCVGELRQVPDYISLFPGSKEVAPFAGALRPLCDRKEVSLDPQTSVVTKFYLFSSTHLASHFQGIILDDFAAEFDPFSPQFGEKFAPAYVPVGVKDWSGNTVNRVYTDQFGLYNGLNYSTWEVNPPNPTGYAPTMMTMCMNDAGFGATPDPLFQPGYSQFCYELPFMPGQTGYFDTPVVPVQAFASGSYNTPDCALPDATPAVASVMGDLAGPWVSAATHPLTIAALGDKSVDWYGYSGPSTTTAPYNQQKITRHYGFGATQGTGTVTIGGISAPVTSWSDTSITVTVPTGVPDCAVQQQALYGGSAAQCGQLVITTATGKQSVDAFSVTIGGKPPNVLAAGATIQSAIDAAQPGDMIIVPQGTYNEMLVMWKPVRLQGVGAATTIIDASAHPAGRLLNPWREKIVGLFGLTPAGRPDTGAGGTCTLDGTTPGPGRRQWCNFASMTVDRLPFEATLGWDAGLNGNLAEQMIEPSLLGAYEGAAITVLGKGVKFPAGTPILDAFGATTGTPGASFPTNTTLISANDCLVKGANPYPTNFYCNPSSIDGLGVRNSSQGGGGIFVHAYAHNLQIANNRVSNNTGTMSGGMTIGTGEHPDVALGGIGQTILTYPTSCETSRVQNLSLPFCFNKNVNIHNNNVVGNSSMGDELFSSTPAGAGGVSINTGADYYQFTNNWVCGNLSSGDGGGFSHIGFIKNGRIEHNSILFNQTTNPSITTNGGGLLVMGAPDADPTTCGVSTDQDCLPAPNEIPPSDGSGPGLVINANLILGNAADSGSGGGLRMQHVNGTDVLNNPSLVNLNNPASRRVACTADLGAAGGGSSYCYWNSISLTNNIIVNNVAGWDGGGASLLDALAVNIVNNTIASNDSTASSGTLFQSLFAPLASSTSPNGNIVCGAGNGSSCPQVSGLVSVTNSPVLQANIDLLAATRPFLCPAGHGVAGAGATKATCYYNSIPLMFNDAIWQNRSFYIGVGGVGSGNTNQQNVVSLYNAAFQGGAFATGTPAVDQTVTGGCPSGSTYWELGFRGDTAPSNHSASGFATTRSILSTATYGGTGNLTSNPAFTSAYCNGSRSPPELGVGGFAVPPGVNEFNAYPNPVFTLKPSGVVDEGNNWINVRWGPLALTSPATGVVLADYVPTTGSPAIDTGAATVGITAAERAAAPSTDFFGNARPAGGGFDIGAIETAGLAAELSVTKVDDRGGKVGANQLITYTMVVTNNGPGSAVGATLTDTLPGGLLFQVASAANNGWSCVASTGASCLATGGGNATRTGTMTLPPNSTATYTLKGTATIIAAALPGITNTVSVAPPTGVTDPITANNTATDTVKVFFPVVVSISPSSGVRGATVPVTITGIGLTGATTVTVSGTGVTCTQVVPVSDISVTASCVITTTATLSARAVTVATLYGASTRNGAFTVTGPIVASIAPLTGAHNTTVPVTLTGVGLTGATAVAMSGGGVTCTQVVPVSDTKVTASCAITNGAARNARNVNVTTPIGVATRANAFTVN